uniref:Uncharacterized protein n=1 Tax=Anopheles maculatus TaxID=74869 RepID=A0A182SC13_9DIPT
MKRAPGTLKYVLHVGQLRFDLRGPAHINFLPVDPRSVGTLVYGSYFGALTYLVSFNGFFPLSFAASSRTPTALPLKNVLLLFQEAIALKDVHQAHLPRTGAR